MSKPKGFRSLRAFHMAGEEGFEPSAYGFGDKKSTLEL